MVMSPVLALVASVLGCLGDSLTKSTAHHVRQPCIASRLVAAVSVAAAVKSLFWGNRTMLSHRVPESTITIGALFIVPQITIAVS